MKEFSNYINERMEDDGFWHDGKLSLDFEQVADPEYHSSSLAAQSFLQVLGLASQGRVSVQQDEDFGPIIISLPRWDNAEFDISF